MAVPYLGSRISLISRSDIRYEGILVHIDSVESTVALSTVRSFGTEDRETADRKVVPPSNEIYDYIIFRSSDIKDLTVCEAPPSSTGSNQSRPNDPAIVSQPSIPQMQQGLGYNPYLYSPLGGGGFGQNQQTNTNQNNQQQQQQQQQSGTTSNQTGNQQGFSNNMNPWGNPMYSNMAGMNPWAMAYMANPQQYYQNLNLQQQYAAALQQQAMQNQNKNFQFPFGNQQQQSTSNVQPQTTTPSTTTPVANTPASTPATGNNAATPSNQTSTQPASKTTTTSTPAQSTNAAPSTQNKSTTEAPKTTTPATTSNTAATKSTAANTQQQDNAAKTSSTPAQSSNTSSSTQNQQQQIRGVGRGGARGGGFQSTRGGHHPTTRGQGQQQQQSNQQQSSTSTQSTQTSSGPKSWAQATKGTSNGPVGSTPVGGSSNTTSSSNAVRSHQPQRGGHHHHSGPQRGGHHGGQQRGPGTTDHTGRFAAAAAKPASAQSNTGIDTNFDFEQFNKKFDKEKIMGDIEKERERKKDLVDVAEVGYSKSDFFDQISCDSLDKDDEPVTRQQLAEQRRLDQETFGAAAGARQNYPVQHHRPGYHSSQLQQQPHPSRGAGPLTHHQTGGQPSGGYQNKQLQQNRNQHQHHQQQRQNNHPHQRDNSAQSRTQGAGNRTFQPRGGHSQNKSYRPKGSSK